MVRGASQFLHRGKKPDRCAGRGIFRLLASSVAAVPLLAASASGPIILPLAPPYLDDFYGGYLLGRLAGASFENSVSTGTFGALAPFVVQQSQVILVQPPGVPETDLAGGGGTQVSRDGTTVVGFLRPSIDWPSYHAFRWRKETGPLDLGTLGPPTNPTFHSVATDVSSDGSVVVGYSLAPAGAAGDREHAFRWTESGGMVDLGSAVGARGYSRALGVSADGRVIVGLSEFPGGARHAFRHTAAEGFQDLGAFDGPFFNSVATAVSADGSVVVGQSDSAGRSRAFRWSQATGLQDLGVLAGDIESGATGVSDDGALVSGISSSEPLSNETSVFPYFLFHTHDRAFLWTGDGGLRDVNDLVGGQQASDPPIRLVAANGISGDGQWIVGAARILDLEPALITGAIVRLNVNSSAGPRLLAKRVGQNLELSWSGTGFVLEQSARLSPPNWIRVGEAGATSVTIPLQGEAAFFRLRGG